MPRGEAYLCFSIFFFFSSRRRHTRSTRDWSSDVCSSDLNKLSKIRYIANGLKVIHSKGFIHKDLHSGNILSWSNFDCYITDLGLCKPVNEIGRASCRERV